MKNRYITSLIFLLTIILMAACSEEFLDKKSDQSLVTPSTLVELEALLNNTGVMNTAPGIPVLGTTDFFYTTTGWQSVASPIVQYGYLWEEDIYRGQLSLPDWTLPYNQIFYSNTVLEALEKIEMTSANETQWKAVKGRALFHRAWSHYQLAQTFSLPYHNTTLNEPGIPLRLNSIITNTASRATIQETYQQIIRDATEAELLLPLKMPSRSQPSKASANALLAIINTIMGNYEVAEQKATLCLEVENTLMDYNTLSTTSTRPITWLNSEIIFHSVSNGYSFASSTQAFIDTTLYASYNTNDLRRSIFFRLRSTNRYTYKGNYSGASSLFTGISLADIYFLRAECRARIGNIQGALQDINTVLTKRWRRNTFTAITEANSEALMKIILSEHHKEMVFRPEVWRDLRRLNLETKYQKTLTRKINGITYTLQPNDKRYVYPIPQEEIRRSGIEQNPR